MKMRGDICRIVNELSSGFLFPEYDFNVLKAYDTVFAYCKEHKTHPRAITVSMDGFALAINGKPVTNVVRYKGPFWRNYEN